MQPPGIGGDVGLNSSSRLTEMLTAASRAGAAPGNKVAAAPPRTSKKQFRCEHCGRMFSTKGNMMRHVQATHVRGGVKMFPCQTCGKGFKRKEDLVMHTRVHTGEKPYGCSHPLCGRKFARISDLRSHERIHSRNAKMFECRHCGKRFTRPYDLKKHEVNIHQHDPESSSCKKTKLTGTTAKVGASAVSLSGAGNGVASGMGRRTRRGITVEVSGSVTGRHMQQASVASESSRPLPVTTVSPALKAGHSVGLVLPAQQQQVPQNPGGPVRRVDLSLLPVAPSIPPRSELVTSAQRPWPRVASAKAGVTQYGAAHRKRVRCEAHKHLDHHPDGNEGDGQQKAITGVVVPPQASSSSGSATEKREDGARREQAKGRVEGVGVGVGSGVHIHGASCGHVPVLHEDHVDFLMDGGQLECFAGREKTRDGWVSNAKQDSNGCCTSRICHAAAKDKKGATASSSTSTTPSSSTSTTASGKPAACNETFHWDGVRPERPRPTCKGETHGPLCGHDVIHHDGHLDFVVDGRLIHPLDTDPAAPDCLGAGMTFEDHGSIRALDEDFVTFWSSLDVLSEGADEDLISFCDMCEEEIGAGLPSTVDGKATQQT